MTGSLEEKGNSPAGTMGLAASRHRFGPWLFVYGAGPECEDAAAAAAAQAQSAEIDVDMCPIDEFSGIVGVGRYFGLVLVFPLLPRHVRPAVGAFRRAVATYRSTHPHGLQDLLSGRVARWCDIGTIQLLVPSALIHNSDVRDLSREVCAVHDLSLTVDVISPYLQQKLTLIELLDSDVGGAEEVLRRHLTRLIDWGVKAPAEIEQLMGEFRSQVARYQSNDRAKAIHRPLHCEPTKTALDLILAGEVEDHEELNSKTNQENFAKVQRDVVVALNRINTNIARPTRGKNATRDLSRFYFSLRTVDRYIRDNGEISWPPGT